MVNSGYSFARIAICELWWFVTDAHTAALFCYCRQRWENTRFFPWYKHTY